MLIDNDFIRTRANLIRHSFIEEMEKHLLAFESVVTSHNIKVQWIIDEKQLVDAVFSLFPKKHYNRVCFDYKHVPEVLLNSSPTLQPVTIEDFESNSADFLFIHADYGIVENGSIVFIDKKSANAFNKISNLIILLDIDKLLVKQNDLETILMLKQENENGTIIPQDVKVIMNPFQQVIVEPFITSSEENHKKEDVNITLFLYDNGIAKILENSVLRESLYCIDCGKCGKVCPVYQCNKKQSPIELIRSNCFEENLKNQNIFGGTTLCGNCNEVCPIHIPLTDLLIEEMEIANTMASMEKTIDLVKTFSKRSRLNKVSSKIRRYLFVRKYFGKNKKLAAYYRNQKEPFFNISISSQTDTNS